ncbi:CRAL TRIO domain containing protein [Asbolus verrucosus]|uniref:CRAL TRIO domain containing protein n=1 Tax=Asbolus verrucosus TaxID=1661398 RepID=A0A482V8C5_ASBVE|nr:CRAL TRIO domain containing protein [Asbolus verrucosus]
MPERLFHVNSNVRKEAPKLFGKTEESVSEDVGVLKKWIQTQHHLPETMKNVKIRNFLLLNKCSIGKTKLKIDMYYTIRSMIPDFYDDANPNNSHMKEYMDIRYEGYFGVHPVLFENMYRVMFYKVKMPNTVVPRLEAMRNFNVAEIRLYEDCMIGEILVCDMANVSFNDLLKITPTFTAKVLAIYQKVYSLRLKAMYIVNSPLYINHFMAVLKKTMKPKIFSRIKVFHDCEVLKQVFPKEILPKDYGGDGPSLEELNEMVKIKLTQYQERFDKLDKLRVNEELRPEKLDNDEMLGFHGNFKKLEVD